MSGIAVTTEPSLVFEDADWFVVDKPAQWLSIPGRSPLPNLLDWLNGRGKTVWVVHRLDRDTTGVILFAKNEEAHRQACIWFEGREMKKRYEFLAQGQAPLPTFKCEEPVEGAPSMTRFERQTQWTHGWRGIALPRTGRRHQIRVHLASRGNPIFGDAEYGAKPFGGANRVMLHSAELKLPDGRGWTAPAPADFARLEASLGAEAS